MKDCPKCNGNGKARSGRECPACKGVGKVSQERFKELQIALKELYKLNRKRESNWSIV
jgi:RecJ-like exonuclease